ncbi:MAG: winged helix-turn-helix domain-containing protein, partial [Alphaproteobacteria bacterium]
MLYLFEDFALDTGRRELRRNDVAVPVEPKVFDLIVHLLANRDRVADKDDLIAAVWGGRIVSEAAVSSAVKAARNALGDDGERQRLIRTLPRKGVRFVGTVTEEPAPLTPPPATAATPASNGDHALPDGPTLAVLPFANMSAEPEQDYFTDGVVEEVIDALSQNRWLFVIARNSSFTYKGREVDVQQVG